RPAVPHLPSFPTRRSSDLVFGVIGLAFFVEGHDDDRCAVAANLARFFQESFFALTEADRVDDALALQAAQAGFDHAPFGGVDHQDRKSTRLNSSHVSISYA